MYVLFPAVVLLVAPDSSRSTFAKDIQIKHIYYTVKVGILFRYRCDTRIDITGEIIKSSMSPSCFCPHPTQPNNSLFPEFHTLLPNVLRFPARLRLGSIPLASKAARWQIIISPTFSCHSNFWLYYRWQLQRYVVTLNPSVLSCVIITY